MHLQLPVCWLRCGNWGWTSSWLALPVWSLQQKKLDHQLVCRPIPEEVFLNAGFPTGNAVITFVWAACLFARCLDSFNFCWILPSLSVLLSSVFLLLYSTFTSVLMLSRLDLWLNSTTSMEKANDLEGKIKFGMTCPIFFLAPFKFVIVAKVTLLSRCPLFCQLIWQQNTKLFMCYKTLCSRRWKDRTHGHQSSTNIKEGIEKLGPWYSHLLQSSSPLFLLYIFLLGMFSALETLKTYIFQ